MADGLKAAKEVCGVDPGAIPYLDLLAEDRPIILKGVVRDWEITKRGGESARAAADYLASFDAGRPVVGYTGDHEIGGRFFYNNDMTGLNFDAKRVPLREFLDRILDRLDEPDAPSFYIGSTDLDTFLPGLADDNHLQLGDAMFEGNRPTVSIWIGNRTVASTHFDFSNNIACNLVGHRRFTLFPPNQIDNLYPGPFAPTPGGQVVSMVDLREPDFGRYPRFHEALAGAQVAELEPGDALLYPAMWWHNVEALDAFNVMINYWWNVSPAFVDTPMTTLLHAILSLRDRPEQEKTAWKQLFDYYVFGGADTPREHLPEHAQGVLAPLDEASARRLRSDLLQRLNR